MSQNLLKTLTEDESSADAIEAYLLAHPNFLLERPTLLKVLNVPHECEGAASLIERQVGALRKENQVLRQGMLDQISTAAVNEKILRGTTRLIEACLRANDLKTLTQACAQILSDIFALNQVSFIVDDAASSYCIPWPQDKIVDFVKRYFPAGKPLCDRFDQEKYPALFGEQAPASFAVVPLGDVNEIKGLLCIGSEDEHHFTRDQDTLFLEYIADVITTILNKNH